MRKIDSKLSKQIASFPALFLFLDYDGTLTRIVRNPVKARLSPQRQKLLREMVRLPGLKIALISGRSLKDLKKLVPVPGLIYAGNHGLEFKIGRGAALYPDILSWKPLLRELTRQLKKPLRPFVGVWVENKGLTLSVHFRCLLSRKVEAARKTLAAILRSRQDFSKLIVREGKKVWEVRPPVPWDKGHMVQWLLAQVEGPMGTPSFPMYIGDDRTDEDAFRAIRKKGAGIKVASSKKGSSQARYYVRSPAEVIRFLRKIIFLRKKKDLHHGQ